VDNYLTQSGLPPTSYFNQAGRAYPDVSTYGSNFFVFLGGQIVRESGTSASAPLFAAMVTLWNDARLAYGMPPLGFLNPFLYEIAASTPEAFTDVTTGNNACGAGGGLETANCCDNSFPATPSYDAVTGLGSPNFNIIAQLVVNQQTLFPATFPNEQASPVSSPTAAPTVSPTTQLPPSSSANSNPSPTSSSEDGTTKGVAGTALFFSLANSLMLVCVVYFLWKLNKSASNSSLTTKLFEGGGGGEVYSPPHGGELGGSGR